MREVITEVNRMDDQENDLIWTSGIRIVDYIKVEEKEDNENQAISLPEDENYTEFIMKVINSATSVTQENKDDFRERTVFEKFKEFSEHLFWVTQEKQYQKMLTQSHSKDIMKS